MQPTHPHTPTIASTPRAPLDAGASTASGRPLDVIAAVTDMLRGWDGDVTHPGRDMVDHTITRPGDPGVRIRISRHRRGGITWTVTGLDAGAGDHVIEAAYARVATMNQLRLVLADARRIQIGVISNLPRLPATPARPSAS